MGVSILATTQRFREYTRAPCEAPVRLQFNSFEDYEEARLANISLGGMFVAYRDPKPVGCLLRFELHLDEAAAPILGLGEVVWIRVRGQGPNRPAGMGIEFRAVKDEDFDRLRRRVERRIRLLGLAPEPDRAQIRERGPGAED